MLLIILALVVALPLALQLRGHGIVAMSASVAAVFAVAIVLLVLVATLPPQSAGWLLDKIATLFVGSSRRSYHNTYYVVADLKAAVLPFLLYAVVALVFWSLARWGAASMPRATNGLFWVMHLSLIGQPIAAIMLRGQGTPNSLIYDSAFDRYLTATALLGAAFLFAVACLIAVALLSALRKGTA